MIQVKRPRGPGATIGRMPLLALGFRPFYLLAGLYAALAVPVWALQYAGWLPRPDLLWHAHEMVFGYAFAVIAGFLLTAVRAWTGVATPSGAALGAIAALWLAARIAALHSLQAAVVLDVLFALALAVGIGRPLVAAGNRRNLFLVAVVLALGAGSAAFLAAPRLALALALDLILFVMCVIGGRVIPMFTNNGVPGAGARRIGWLEKAALGSIVLLLFTDLFSFGGKAGAAMALIAGGLHLWRLALWAPLKTSRKPIVWILHASYAWIVAHLLLRGLAGFDLAAPALATHALTVGAIGGLTLGMMTRTARGHTARPLQAGAPEVAAYSLVMAAAVVRVLVPLAVPGEYVHCVVASALLWSAAFAIFAATYLPILSRPRLDGQPG